MKQVGNTILAKGGNHILAKRDNSAWPKGSKLSGFSNHHGTSVAGNGNNVNTTSALEKALESLMEQQRLTAKAQEQVDRLLSLMERMTK